MAMAVPHLKLELHEAHVPRAKMTDNINAHVYVAE